LSERVTREFACSTATDTAVMYRVARSVIPRFEQDAAAW
jgi:hypothetical protein